MKKGIVKKREELVLNFFAKQTAALKIIFLSLTIICAGISLYFLYLDRSITNANFLAFLVLAIIFQGIFWLLISNLLDKKITGEEYLKILEKDLVDAYNSSFKSLAINEKDFKYNEPIICFSPQMYPYSGKLDYTYDNKTGNLYYSQSKFSAIMFGEEELYFYNSNINHIQGVNSYEEAKECRYEDIVNVTTKTDVIKVRNVYHDFLKMTFSFKDSSSTDIIIRNKIYIKKSVSLPLFCMLSTKNKLLLLLGQSLFTFAIFYLMIAAFSKDIFISFVVAIVSLLPGVLILLSKRILKLLPSATLINDIEEGIITNIRNVIRSNRKK